MAAPSTPVIQGVNSVYPFGYNIRATWVTDTSVTSCSAVLYFGETATALTVDLFESDANTKTWVTRPAPEEVGTYSIGVTATNGDGTSDEATASFIVADYSGIVLSPSGTVTELPINVAWSIDDPNGVAAQSIVFQPSDHSRVMYSATLPPTQRTLTLGVADLAGIEDGTSYEILLNVTNGVGLVTSAWNTVTTSWAAPDPPTATIVVEDSDMSASVTVEAPSTTPAVVSIMLARVMPDGTRHVIAEGLADGDTVRDPLPPLGVEYSYEVTGVAATGVPSTPATVTHTNVTTCWALNFGADGSDVVTLFGNPKASSGIDHGGRAYHFADGGAGGGLPVWYGTSERDENGTVTFETVGPDYARTLRRLSLQSPIAWLRDPFGNRWRAHVTPKVTHGTGELWTISIDWDAVRFREIGA